MTEIVVAATAFAGLAQAISASDAVKKGLHSVKVSEASILEKQLHGELFEKWQEKVEILSSDISMRDIDPFLQYLQDSFKGIDDEKKEEIKIILTDNSWTHYIVEWNWYNPDNSGAKYSTMFLGRSSDGKLPYLIADITVAFKISSKRKEIPYTGSCLSRDILESISKEDRRNYFHFLILNKCVEDGYIESSNSVNSPMEITTTKSSEVLSLDVPQSHTDSSKKSPEKSLDASHISTEGSSEKASEAIPNSNDLSVKDQKMIEARSIQPDGLPKNVSLVLSTKVSDAAPDSNEGFVVQQSNLSKGLPNVTLEDNCDASTGVFNQGTEVTAEKEVAHAPQCVSNEAAGTNSKSSAGLKQKNEKATSNPSKFSKSEKRASKTITNESKGLRKKTAGDISNPLNKAQK